MNFNLINVPGTLENFLCKLVTNRNIVGCLYDAFDKGQIFISQGRNSYFKFIYPGIELKTYEVWNLVTLNNEAQITSYSTLFSDLNVDNVVRIFFKARPQIGGLYCAHSNALTVVETARTRIYRFTNPFVGFINLNRNSVTTNLCDVLKLFCLCGDKPVTSIFS